MCGDVRFSGAELSGHFGSLMVPKFLGSEVSRHRRSNMQYFAYSRKLPLPFRKLRQELQNKIIFKIKHQRHMTRTHPLSMACIGILWCLEKGQVNDLLNLHGLQFTLQISKMLKIGYISYTGWLKKSKLLYCVNSLLFWATLYSVSWLKKVDLVWESAATWCMVLLCIH